MSIDKSTTGLSPANGPSGTGPLRDTRVVEFSGLGPAPFAAMMLADMGAEVVRIARAPGDGSTGSYTLRSRRSITIDVKKVDGRDLAMRLIDRADVLIEGFRPGVMERLGLGPREAMSRNPRLIYARMTGWGQSGPRAHTAGHDINYLAITGALYAMGTRETAPNPPLNVVGDYGGGALFLVTGVLAALIEANKSGLGQVVDCAICDGVNAMMGLFHELRQRGDWLDECQSNLIDGGAPFYTTYRCADGKFVALGAIETQFFHVFCEKAGLDETEFADRMSKAAWPRLRTRLEQVFLTRSQAAWVSAFEGSDACVAPVHDLRDSLKDEQLISRNSFIELSGLLQPAPAPRFSRSTSEAKEGRMSSVEDVFADWGLPLA